MAGVNATLEGVTFMKMSASSSRVSTVAHGVGTVVVVQGGSVTGGKQAVAVQAGAHLEASDLTITDLEVKGVEVKDEGSSLKLSSCKFRGFSSLYTDIQLLVTRCMRSPVAVQTS